MSIVANYPVPELSREQIGQIMTVICLADIVRLQKNGHIITLDGIKGCSIDLTVRLG